jgi:hypothetical protein
MLGRTLQRFEPMRLMIMLGTLRDIISDYAVRAMPGQYEFDAEHIEHANSKCS